MPKRVDHEERRQHIAAALLCVISRDGLEAVSLRHVATEAGVTAGMVQHYFPSKNAMMQFAMRTASSRYEQRINAILSELGDAPDAGQFVRIMLRSLLPADTAEAGDARIALAFQSYAANHVDAAEELEEGNRTLCEHLAELLVSTGANLSDPLAAATALFATTEGLAVQMLSARLPHDKAVRALDQHIELLINPNRKINDQKST